MNLENKRNGEPADKEAELIGFHIIEIEQRTQEWYDFRNKKIGSSHAAAIMNESPWDTPLSLFEGIVSNRKIPVNKAMQRGMDEEAAALKAYSFQKGIEYKPIVLQSARHPELIASIDGFDLSSCAGVEIKTPGTENHLKALGGRFPSLIFGRYIIK